MSDIWVIGFPGDKDAAGIAKFLEADLVDYHDDVFENAFRENKSIVAVMATGIVVRKIAPLIHDKWTDPPVVVVPSGCRYAIPLIGGHHGANELAKRLTGIGAEAGDNHCHRGEWQTIGRISHGTTGPGYHKQDVDDRSEQGFGTGRCPSLPC